MKKFLFTGLAVLLPMAVTIFVIIFLVDLLTAPFVDQVSHLLRAFTNGYFDMQQHAALLTLLSRIIVLILLFIVVIFLGFLAKKLFFNWLINLMHKIMLRIPVINKIYKVTKDIITAVFSEKEKIFNRSVLVPFPLEDSRAMGLVTGTAPHEVQPPDIDTHPHDRLKTVFVPTSPHPISGLLLLVREGTLIKAEISVEDVFKFLISCGIYEPEHIDDK